MTQQPKRERQKGTLLARVVLIPFAVAFLVLVSPIILLVVLADVINREWLIFRVRREWYPQGKRLLFVYSDSPNWKAYIEQNILPRFSDEAMVMNWSERSRWEWGRSLALRVFEHWAGVKRYFWQGRTEWEGSEFCPIAIVFMPGHRPRVIPFWKPSRTSSTARIGCSDRLSENSSGYYKVRLSTERQRCAASARQSGHARQSAALRHRAELLHHLLHLGELLQQLIHVLHRHAAAARDAAPA
jgi:hypothetical protein